MSSEALPSAAESATDPAGDGLPLEDWIAHEKLRAIASQERRVRLSTAVMDVYLVWLMWDAGLGRFGFVWAAVSLALYEWRWRLPRRYVRFGGDPQRVETRLHIATGLIGAARGTLAIPLFMLPLSATHFVITTVLVGQMAGGMGAMIGLTRGYALLSAGLCLPMALGWLVRGSALTAPVGVLMVLLYLTLVTSMRDNERLMRQAFTLTRRTRELAASLREERDRAEQASASKTRFFAAASHDLRQPLHALSLRVSELAHVAQHQGDPQVRELSQDISHSLRDSNEFLESLLDMTRLDAGAVTLRHRPLDAGALLQAVHAQFGADAASRGLTLSLEAVATEPDGTGPWLMADHDTALRILNNLVGNALKFTDQGGVCVTASTAPGPTADRVVLAVADTGKGIPEAEQQRVFEEFYQLDNPSRDRQRGLGLGLSIVKRSVDLLGGTLELRSRLGEGTTIDVVLPRSAAAVQGLALRERPVEAPPLTSLDASVLAVDDAEQVRDALTGLLSAVGCDVRVSASGDEAMGHLAAGFRPEVLLVDYRLQHESGIEVIARLREHLGPLPALLVTGDTTAEVESGAADGRWLVVHKPLDGQRLVALLRAAAGASRDDDDDSEDEHAAGARIHTTDDASPPASRHTDPAVVDARSVGR